MPNWSLVIKFGVKPMILTWVYLHRASQKLIDLPIANAHRIHNLKFQNYIFATWRTICQQAVDGEIDRVLGGTDPDWWKGLTWGHLTDDITILVQNSFTNIILILQPQSIDWWIPKTKSKRTSNQSSLW